MFPERLKQLRKEKGMTQLDLAAALNVSSGTVAMWETGKRKPSFDMFDKLTEVFDKRIDYILGATDDPSPATLSNNDITPLGEWVIQEEYEDVMRKYSLLDEFGQKAINAVLRSEFARCQEQNTLKSGKSISVSVKIRELTTETVMQQELED